MFDTRKTVHNRGILDVIKILASNGESGKLQMSAGRTEGAFFFRNGQLVDASVGHLKGFQAVNAVASMRNAHFDFDPTVTPPLESSITPNERVVLRQFFGIETADSNGTQEIPTYSDMEEVTIETRRIPVEAIRADVIPVDVIPAHVIPADAIPAEVLQNSVADTPASKSLLYRGGLILAILFILIGVGAVALRNKYRERADALPPTVAATHQSAPPAVAEEVKYEIKEEVKPAAKSEVKPEVKAEVNKPETKAAVKPEVKVESPTTSVDQPMVAQDLTGKWNVVNSVQKTSYRSFQNLKIGFEISINQNGKSFTGTGQKISENGRSLPAASRTPIQVKGAINGDRVEATFFENGVMRKTNGRFVWRIDKAGAGLNGTFVSTAAGSSGNSTAKREL